MNDEATVLMRIYHLHLRASRAGKKADRERLFKMVDDFEWAFPDAAKEIREMYPGTE